MKYNLTIEIHLIIFCRFHQRLLVSIQRSPHYNPIHDIPQESRSDTRVSRSLEATHEQLHKSARIPCTLVRMLLSSCHLL